MVYGEDVLMGQLEALSQYAAGDKQKDFCEWFYPFYCSFWCLRQQSVKGRRTEPDIVGLVFFESWHSHKGDFLQCVSADIYLIFIAVSGWTHI